MLDLFSKISPPPVSQVSNVTVYSILIRAIQRIPLARAPRRARNVDRTQRGRVWIHSNCPTSPYNAPILRPSARDTRISHLAIYVWQGVGQSRIEPTTSIQLANCKNQTRFYASLVRIYCWKEDFVDDLADTLRSSRRVMIWILSYVKICTTYSYSLQLS